MTKAEYLDLFQAKIKDLNEVVWGKSSKPRGGPNLAGAV